MREIKFRVFDTTTHDMHYPGEDDSQLVIGLGHAIDEDRKYIALWSEEGEICRTDQAEFMQFTGLKDKNGREIYEGDIVDTTYDGSTFIGVVVYDLSELDFKATDGKEHYRQNFQYLPCCDEIEVIGNVYENPELLEVAE